MRHYLLYPSFLLAATLNAQAQPTRFIEVLVTDTLLLPFAGMDQEVSMPNPMDLVVWDEGDGDRSEKDNERMLKEAQANARTVEDKFLAEMGSGGFNFRKSSSTTSEDYSFNTGQTFEVNTYLVTLKDAVEMERFNNVMDASDGLHATMKDLHFGTPDAQAPRLMRKLYEQARKKAEAIVAVTGGKLGALISAQELQKNEGSILEQLFRMDKMGHNDEETLRMMSGTHTTTMSFRFEFSPI